MIGKTHVCRSLRLYLSRIINVMPFQYLIEHGTCFQHIFSLNKPENYIALQESAKSSVRLTTCTSVLAFVGLKLEEREGTKKWSKLRKSINHQDIFLGKSNQHKLFISFFFSKYLLCADRKRFRIANWKKIRDLEGSELQQPFNTFIFIEISKIFRYLWILSLKKINHFN